MDRRFLMTRLLEVEHDTSRLAADDFPGRYRLAVERDGLKALIEELEDMDGSVSAEWERQAERHRDEFELRKGYLDDRGMPGGGM